MQIIINEKILSIPPFISTTWESVTALHISNEGNSSHLVISLNSGTVIKVPNLSQDLLTKIFQTHTQYISSQDTKNRQKPMNDPAGLFNLDSIAGIGFPMRFGGGLEGLGAAMQHNPEQSNAPNLPKDVLEKISAVAKIMDSGQNLTQSLKPEPHCNCMHCQIARAVNGIIVEEVSVEEEVSEDDLKFKTWDITQSGDKLYTVSNPLDTQEHYSVYLGEPLGCTCGQKNCEHIKAVLNT